MRAFHFLNTQYALQALQTQRLKVALLSEINDPFELFAADLSDRNVRFAFRNWKNDFAQRTGMLCFSERWKNPLLWSHYADRHRGMVLGFEIDEQISVPVQYRRTRIRLDVTKIVADDGFSSNLAEDLYATKSIDWSYEEEVRVPTLLSDCEVHDGHYFELLGNQLKIVSVILGPLCKVDPDDIRRNLPAGNNVKLYRSRMAFRSFDIVRNKEYPVKRIRGLG